MGVTPTLFAQVFIEQLLVPGTVHGGAGTATTGQKRWPCPQAAPGLVERQGGWFMDDMWFVTLIPARMANCQMYPGGCHSPLFSLEASSKEKGPGQPFSTILCSSSAPCSPHLSHALHGRFHYPLLKDEKIEAQKG